MEAEVRETPTTDALLAEVREGIEQLVREALAEAERLREEADATLARYDDLVNEATRLRSEIFGLRRDLEGIPERINKARLDSLIPDGGGEDPALLERRYIQVRERLPVAEARIARLESELSSLVSGGSRPAQVNPNGGQRKLLKHNATSPALDALNEAMATLKDLHEALEEVVPLGGEELRLVRKRLLDLEKEVITFADEAGLPKPFPKVGPEQVHGIELNEYAHDLATATVWIGYIQWLRDNGFGQPAEPILKPLETVEQMDAILARDEDGTLREPDWPEADVIVGNPPFLGDKKMRAELGHGYVDALRKLYGGRVPGGADLVTYWFEQAREQIEDGSAKRAGLLATNSIRGGVNRQILQRIREVGSIFFAEADRPWVLDGAAVRVSMVGFDDGSETQKVLDGAPVEQIYADLTGALDLASARRLPENSHIAFIGTQKGGAFDLKAEEAREMLAAAGNPNGRPNSEVVRPWINGLDITRRPRGMWIVDFGTDMPEEDAAMYEAPFERVRTLVYPARKDLRRENHRRYWWLHAESRPGMRRALAPLSRYVSTARVAKHRLFVWTDTTTLPDSQVVVFARDGDYFFGVLHSRAHEYWSLRTGNYMGVGNDLRYSVGNCFETFPHPEPTEEQRAEIAEAARRLDGQRRNWLNPEDVSEADLKKRTLTNLYNARPTWLDNAHKKLDAAVFAAYGWPEDIADEDILKNLLALNLERSERGAPLIHPNA